MSLSVLDWTLTGLPGWGGGATSQEAGGTCGLWWRGHHSTWEVWG